MKTRKLLLICISLLVSFILYGSSADIILKGDNKYKSFKLTPEIYKNSNRDFSGMYIKDSDNEEVPFFILSRVESIEYSKSEKDLVLINSFIKEKDFYLDYRVGEIGEKDTLGTSINFNLNNLNFFSNIELFGSYDNLNWEKITEDTLYKTPQSEKNEINFNGEKKYTFFRLKLINNSEKIKLKTPKLIFTLKNENLNYFTDAIEGKFQVKDEQTVTIIEVDVLKNLKIKSVEIETDDFFKRDVTTSTNQMKTLYNLNINSEKSQNTTLNFYGDYLDDVLKIYIENNANKSLKIKGIKIVYYFDYLVFEAKNNKNLKLEFSEEDKNIKLYDIDSYKKNILKEKIDVVDIKNIVIIEKEKQNNIEVEKINYKLIFNVITIVLGLLIGIFILKNLKSKK